MEKNNSVIHGIFPNIYSKEKFASISGFIKKHHDMEQDIYNVFYNHGGNIDYPDGIIEDQLVKALEMMFMDDNCIISSYIYDYDFCEEFELIIYEKDNGDIDDDNNDSNANIKKYVINNTYVLYDYLVQHMIERLGELSSCDTVKVKFDSDIGIDNFVKLFKSIYKIDNDINSSVVSDTANNEKKESDAYATTADSAKNDNGS